MLQPGSRLVSLDVFRGITMAAMVVVNNPGDWGHVYAPLLHAPWDGWTPTDLIFPFFLFIVGVSITLSRRSGAAGSILKRAAVIFAVGLFLSGYPRFDLDTWRIPGVLQRIAICYAAAALLYARTRRPSVVAGVAAALMLAYWAVMMLVPVPGGTAGDLSPEGNLGAFVDRALMAGHLWKPGWDPEGLLSTVPAIATTLLGVLAGLWIGSPVPAPRKAALLALAGVAGIGIGYAWDVVFPINKSLWTSSYVMFSAGAAALFLALCYWVIDVMGYRKWATPFVILGANALALYALAALLSSTLSAIRVAADDGRAVSLLHLIYTAAFEPLASPRNASLLYALANLAVLFLILLWMYRRRIFLRA
jgi:predicted acyltransferase